MFDDSDWFRVLLRIIVTAVMLCVLFTLELMVGGVLLLLVIAR